MKNYMLAHIASLGKPVKCIKIIYNCDDFSIDRKAILRVYFNQDDLDEFLKSIDITGGDYGIYIDTGIIWYTDGTYSEWVNEYDYSGWDHRCVPVIPEECQPTEWAVTVRANPILMDEYIK